MRRRLHTGRIVLAGAMVAAAVLLALLAHDAWRWGRALHAGDARAAVAPVGPTTWGASTVLPNGFVRNALGIDDDLTYRQAVADTIALIAPTAGTASSAKQAIVVETELARLSQNDPDPVRASRAADYLGLLFYAERNNPAQVISPYVNPKDAASGSASDRTPEQKAADEFALAVRLDPANTEAKRHLEIMLHVLHPPSERVSPRPGSGEAVGHRGSGSRPPGFGY